MGLGILERVGLSILFIKAVTKTNVDFSYTETGTGQTLSGKGTGKLNDDYNCLVFDVENSDSNGSTGKDFLNLFDYIKNNEKFYV